MVSRTRFLGFEYFSEFQDSTVFRIKNSPLELGTYTKMKYSLSDRLILEPGVRLNYYNVFPDSLYPDLRFGLKYLLTDDRYINLSVGNYHQFISTFQDDFNPPSWIVG